MMTDKKYKVLDLFAGCGGLSKGFEQAGFNIIGANEFWGPAGETYMKNHPETIFVPGDVTLDETKQQIYNIFENKKCDVLTGGPPCQGFSTAGLRDPDDPRGRLFEDYVEIVEKLQPKIFVMENVKGILTMEHDREDLSEEETKDFESYKLLEKERAGLVLLRKKSKNNPEKFKWGSSEMMQLDQVRKDLRLQMKDTMQFREKITDQILRRFKKIGYNVKFKLLTASDFGVPQKRQRVIFIGTKFPIEIKHPEPTHSKDGVNLPIWNTVRNAIDDLSDKPEDISFNHIITTHGPEFLEKIRNTKIGSSVFGGYADAFFRNQPDEPSRTVKENHGGVLVHYKNNRVMTPRELARLQSFPDDFIFASSKSNILKQIGNAVPVGLANAIGEAVSDMLKEIEKLNN
jgi:site-specific DNA-cytosine methylase